MNGTTQPLPALPVNETKEKSKNLDEKYVGESGDDIGLGNAMKVISLVAMSKPNAIMRDGLFLLMLYLLRIPIALLLIFSTSIDERLSSKVQVALATSKSN